jgi:hypothetical protein
LRSTPAAAPDHADDQLGGNGADGDAADAGAEDDVSSPPIAPWGGIEGLARSLVFVDVDMIEVRERLRDLREDELAQLKESIQQRGLLHPILVRFEAGPHGFRPILLAGLYRLAAVRRLGWRHILCRAIDGDAIEYQLVEIDENLKRVDLGPATQALLLGRRHELYERQHGPAKSRGAHAANAAMGNANAAANLAPAFSTATAAIASTAERTIQRGVARCAALGADLLKRVSGTSLDLGVELDALAALPSQERDALVDRAAGGEQVSAAEALKAAAQAEQPAPAGEKSEPPQPAGQDEEPAAPKPADPAHDEPPADDHGSVDNDDRFADFFDDLDRGFEALQQAWLRAPIDARCYFLSWLASGWRSPEAHH